MRDHVLGLVRRYLPGPFKPTGAGSVQTRCPFHKDGEERKPSFGINLENGIYHCFTCHESGNIKTLLKKLNVPESSIEAEIKIIQPLLDRSREKYNLEKQHIFEGRNPFKADYVLPESILGVFDWCPLQLVNDGFDANLLKAKQVGYDKNQNRITYPLRDMYGNLAGFSCGITPATSQPWPKYRVYQGRRKGLDGRWIPGDYGEWFDEQYPDYRCENHDFLWNFHNVMPRMMSMSDPNATLYLVEGFKACLWMVQSGFENTVALMGSYITDKQQHQLHRLGCTVVICLDNDSAGRRATLVVGDLLWRPMYGKVKVMSYPDGDEDTQPDDYEADALKELVTTRAKTHFEHINALKRSIQ